MLLVASTTEVTFGGWALSRLMFTLLGEAPESEMLRLPPSAGAKQEPSTSARWPSTVICPRAATVLAGAIVAGFGVLVWSFPFRAW